MSNKELEKALEGLIHASEYAGSIGEHAFARHLAQMYQEMARVSPDEHWDEIGDWEEFVRDD